MSSSAPLPYSSLSITAAAMNTHSTNLPAEIFYPVFELLSSKRELSLLATTSRILQRPAESALYKDIVLHSREDVVRFCETFHRTPRFGSLVRTLIIECPTARGELDERYRSDAHYREEYWGGVRDTLRGLHGLEEINIHDGRDNFLSWVLEGLGSEKLMSLQCSFVLDEVFLGFLKTKTRLKEFSWTGSLLSLPSITTSNEGASKDKDTQIAPDAESPIIDLFNSFLGSETLKNLQFLRTESLALARALVPGRRITHLWIPGASFATPYTSDYVYSHISVPNSSDIYPISRSSTTITSSHSYPGNNYPLRATTNLRDLSDAQISAHLCNAIRDFSKSKGPILSLRLSLGMTNAAVRDVLVCISKELPFVRALGYLPAGIVHSSTFPSLPNLHTLALWSLPPARALAALASSSSLPSLRSLACLHYSPSFEWICIPVDDQDDMSATRNVNSQGSTTRDFRDTGGVPWDRSVPGEHGKIGQRRPTAMHDPKNLLWRDV